METVMIAYATAATPDLFRTLFAALRRRWRERRTAAALATP